MIKIENFYLARRRRKKRGRRKIKGKESEERRERKGTRSSIRLEGYITKLDNNESTNRS